MTNVMTKPGQPIGDIIEFNHQPHYRIQHIDRMAPFLMTMVSPYDHWLFQSSRGGMTAGRVDAHQALTPYYTDDKLHALSGQQGAAAQFWVTTADAVTYWCPFQGENDPFQRVERNLYKHVYGHQITFEEKHLTLHLTYRYTWYTSERLGFILHTEIINESNQPVQINGMQGVRQLLPAGVKQNMQDLRSNLMAAYKKNEWYQSIALYRLSALPIDRATPAEALQTHVAWHCGHPTDQISLSDDDWWAFAHQNMGIAARETKGENGAFLWCQQGSLSPGEPWENYAILDTSYQAHQVSALQALRNQYDPLELVQADIRKTHNDLLQLLAATDGLQVLGDKQAQYRHANNVLFNDMRGGLVFQDTSCPIADVSAYLQAVNHVVGKQAKDWLQQLPDPIPLEDLRKAALNTQNADLIRLLNDYMPIGFSRRHGDPSRPWNAFHIKVKDDQGYHVLYYEGNWRDIFQNWEALSHSYPALLPGMVSKFWNATTIDGYNPYRIEKNGVDWEILEPHDDWSYVGYWGDHQIVYQTKLLERWQATAPGEWLQWLDKAWFVCPDVPYRIKSAEDLFQDASDTITFQQAAHDAALQRMESMGWDGKNRIKSNGELLKVTGLEKLLITLSAKLDNLIPGVGIWMNTQRPEWNDANNALVGRGASAVTVYQLRKHLSFLDAHLGQGRARYTVQEAILFHWNTLLVQLEEYQQSKDALSYLKAAATAGAQYRDKAYRQELGPPVPLDREELLDQLSICMEILDETIAANQREDGLYHAYHLVQVDGQRLATEPLYLMLEGQAAILDAGVLSKAQGWRLMQALQQSDIYEARQNSYLLYPNRQLPSFMERNIIRADWVRKNKWLVDVLTHPHQQVLVKGDKGVYHFHAAAINQQALLLALQPFKSLPSYTASQEKALLQVYEEQFHHSAFTGRSGTFYGYEGLGSIYWHMVSKLVLAAQQEIIRWGVGTTDPQDIAIREWYAHARAGIGWNKSPEIYGAIPLDPYSHTPYLKGARQPGMTGQVKEDIIARFGDIGITVQEGRVSCQPIVLPEDWWTTESYEWQWPSGATVLDLSLPAGSLAFTYGGVLVVYCKNETPFCKQVQPKSLSVGESVDMSTWESWRGDWVIIHL